MLINCFRPAAKTALAAGEHDDLRPQPARQRPNPRKTATFLRRSGTDNSRVSSTSSTTSNESISKLPPCKRRSDAEIDALMMPVPHNERPSRCLRLSHPKMYSSLVSEMKASRGCRNWKDFDVFYADEVDMNVSAIEKARKTAEMHARKMRGFDSFDSGRTRSKHKTPPFWKTDTADTTLTHSKQELRRRREYFNASNTHHDHQTHQTTQYYTTSKRPNPSPSPPPSKSPTTKPQLKLPVLSLTPPKPKQQPPWEGRLMGDPGSEYDQHEKRLSVVDFMLSLAARSGHYTKMVNWRNQPVFDDDDDDEVVVKRQDSGVTVCGERTESGERVEVDEKVEVKEEAKLDWRNPGRVGSEADQAEKAPPQLNEHGLWYGKPW